MNRFHFLFNWMKRHRKKMSLVCVAVLATSYFFCLPATLFQKPYSTVLLSSDGQLLSATIADDGQWRFPLSDSMPVKFKEAIIAFEDKRFYSHPGVDILSFGRALKQNIAAGKIKSGGSTLSMQVIRLSRGNQPRTVFEKAYEMILATRLEFRHSKDEILSLYASHAPFGGNVVGLDAACWRYFGTDSKDLSWGQAALLAVLPNSPALIHPGKNRTLLKQKRDRLLDKLKAIGKIDQFTNELAKNEPLPDAPYPLPGYARHLLVKSIKDGKGGHRNITTIDYDLQRRVEEIINSHHLRLKNNQIYNGAAVVLDVKTGNVLAYAGNVTADRDHENEVDVIQAARSTGSILKPILYAAMLDEGKILQGTLLPDVPVLINGFSPKNFSHEYDGAVPADKALIRSLNVPAVHMLQEFRYEKFYSLLKNVGMSTLKNPPDHYGLSLILGGAEGTLWDITGIYASMARSLNNYFEYPGKRRYKKSDFHQPRYIASNADSHSVEIIESSWLSAGSIYFTFEALKELYRPGEETGWRYFGNSKDIAWKTGTSFGYRDGWAVGVTPDYAIGVWIGNADGEGRPGLTGTKAASPVMFEIFSSLTSKNKWFDLPNPELTTITTCAQSGYRSSSACIEIDTVKVVGAGLATKLCPFHKTVHLSADLKHQVHDQCASLGSMRHVKWFVLPPVQEFYYKQLYLSYKPLPPVRSDCFQSESVASMDMIYPKNNSKLFIPRELNGETGSSVFELAHRNSKATVYWHLDGKYVGSTRTIHHLPLSAPAGKHVLTLVDDAGSSIERRFEIISKM
jgi:penicillin-binding protein 1C